jgi:protochlorophyllide reductase
MTDRRVFVVTGATSGLGLEAARILASRVPDARLIVGARRPEAATALRAAVPAQALAVLPLDLGSLDSVRQFAASVETTRQGAPVAGLVCNAGLQVVSGHRHSADGHELTFAANHLGHALLTRLLLPVLAPGAAVVSTASGTHDPADGLARRFGFRGGIFPDAMAVARGDLDRARPSSLQGMDRYATSKLCNILFTYAMARRVPAAVARFIAFDPGLMPGTGLARDATPLRQFAWRIVLPLIAVALPGTSTPARSGAALAALLVEPDLAPGTGLHLDQRLRRKPSSADSHRADWQDDLYETSLRLGGLAPD